MSSRNCPLGELVEINPSLPRDASPLEIATFVPMAALDAESASIRIEESSPIGEMANGFSYFQSGDILVAKITPCFQNGKIAEASVPTKHAFGSTEFHVLRPKRDCLVGRYLMHFLRQSWVLQEGERKMTGSAGQRRIPTHFLESLDIPTPPLPEQRRIAAILDQAEALRAKRRAALAKLDILAQSTFIEMFGDPVTNPKHWPMVRLGDLVFSASDGPHVSPTYAETGIPFLSTRHIRPGEISWTDLKYITQQDAEVQWRKCRPTRGDILYTKGGTTGFAATVETDDPFAVWVHVALLKPRHDIVDPRWLEAMLNTSYCYRQSQELTHGIANRDLGLKRMVNIKMYQPPLAHQKDFVSAFGKIKSIKSTLVESGSNLDSLFASLQHRAFRGEL